MASRPPRQVADSLVDYLTSEIVAYYGTQDVVPPTAALDAIGFRVGYQLAELHAAGRPRLGDALDIVKYVCKDLWSDVFGKQIDNLRTNHRGTFVLRDAAFTRLTRFAVVDWGDAAAAPPASPRAGGPAAAPSPSSSSAPAVARDHLRLPAAMVRGALAALGLEASVSAEAAAPPAVDFTVTLKPPAPAGGGGVGAAPVPAPAGGVGGGGAGGAGGGAGAGAGGG